MGIKPSNIETLLREEKYILTLDYVVKMLNIHERHLCGVPVIINGETGVGKTHLLSMMSKLWNQSVLTKLTQERGRLLNLLELILKQIRVKQEVEDYKKNHGNFGHLSEIPTYKTKDIDTVEEVLAMILDNESISTKLNTSKLCSQFKKKLIDVLKLRHPNTDTDQSVCEIVVPALLARQYEPCFAVVCFPEQNLVNLFNIIRKNEMIKEVAIKFLHLSKFDFI